MGLRMDRRKTVETGPLILRAAGFGSAQNMATPGVFGLKQASIRDPVKTVLLMVWLPDGGDLRASP
jgi:hypothetical protein